MSTATCTKLRNHTVLDICRILSEKNHTPISVTHSEAVALKFKGIRADKILEIVTFPHRLGNIEVERCFFSCTVEVVEDTQLVACVQFHTLRPQTVKVGDKVSTHTGEVVSGCALSVTAISFTPFLSANETRHLPDFFVNPVFTPLAPSYVLSKRL